MSPQLLQMKLARKTEPDEIDVLIMQLLRQLPPPTLRELALYTHRSHITVYQRVNWLRKNGYVTRPEYIPEKSGRTLVLTQKGADYIENAKRLSTRFTR